MADFKSSEPIPCRRSSESTPIHSMNPVPLKGRSPQRYRRSLAKTNPTAWALFVAIRHPSGENQGLPQIFVLKCASSIGSVGKHRFHSLTITPVSSSRKFLTTTPRENKLPIRLSDFIFFGNARSLL